MQIYTNFESNSQLGIASMKAPKSCFRCKFTQILKAIHNHCWLLMCWSSVVSDANLHKFWKQFTTIQTHYRISEGCFRCKFTQILKAIHNYVRLCHLQQLVVSDANLHKFWKQFTTIVNQQCQVRKLFPMQIYTNFESNSQLMEEIEIISLSCFRCKFTQILKAIHNLYASLPSQMMVVSDANLHKFWKQFTTIVDV